MLFDVTGILFLWFLFWVGAKTCLIPRLNMNHSIPWQPSKCYCSAQLTNLFNNKKKSYWILVLWHYSAEKNNKILHIWVMLNQAYIILILYLQKTITCRKKSWLLSICTSYMVCFSNYSLWYTDIRHFPYISNN